MSQQYTCPTGVTINGIYSDNYAQILSPEAIEFLAKLHRKFNGQDKNY